MRLINNHENWNATGTLVDEDALLLFTKSSYDLVLLGGGVDQKSETWIRKNFLEHNPEIKIILHWGGGSGLLENEIRSALDNNKEGNFSI